MLTVLVKSGLLAMAHMLGGFSVAYAVTGSAAAAMGVALIGAHLVSMAYLLLHRSVAKRLAPYFPTLYTGGHGAASVKIAAADFEYVGWVPVLGRVGIAGIGAGVVMHDRVRPGHRHAERFVGRQRPTGGILDRMHRILAQGLQHPA